MHADTLKLVVRAYGIDAVLVRGDLPELGPDLIAALTALDMDELAHGVQTKDNKESNRPGYSEVPGSSS